MKSFSDLNIIQPLNDLCSQFGWINPTEVQICSIPESLNGIEVSSNIVF